MVDLVEGAQRRREQEQSGTCGNDGCERPAARGGLCWSCVKKAHRTGRFGEAAAQRPDEPSAVLRAASRAYWEADTDEDFNRAKDRMRKAGIWCGEAALLRAIASGRFTAEQVQALQFAAQVLQRARRGGTSPRQA